MKKARTTLRIFWTAGILFFVLASALFAYGTWKDRIIEKLVLSGLHLSFYRPYERHLVSRLPPRTPDFIYHRIVRPVDSIFNEPKTATFGSYSHHDPNQFHLCSGFFFRNIEKIEAKSATQIPNALTYFGDLPNCRIIRFVGQDTFLESNFKAASEKLPRLEQVILCAKEIEWDAAYHMRSLPVKQLYTETVRYETGADFGIVAPLRKKEAIQLAEAFPRLEELYISVSDSSALQELHRLRQLQTLSLVFRHSSVDLLLGAETEFPKLAWTDALYMPQTFGTQSPGFFATTPFPNIKRLGLANLDFKNEHGKAIQHTFPNITHITVRGGRLAPTAIETLFESKHLITIELYGTKIAMENTAVPPYIRTTLLIQKERTNTEKIHIRGNGYEKRNLSVTTGWKTILQDACTQLKPDPH